jgi:hypothetical protein
MSEVDTSGGRRIYIHKGSFEDLARQNEQLAWHVSLALFNVRVAKVAHHHIEQGQDLGSVRPQVAQTFMSPIVAARDESLSTLFTEVGYRPKLPYRPERLLPILRLGETVVDTCFQDGYYTFATGAEAAARMFEDREPMPSLKNSLASGKGPHDLTIISGNSLTTLGYSNDAACVPNAQVSGQRLTEEELFEIDGWVRDVQPRLDNHTTDVDRRVGGLEPDELRVIQAFSRVMPNVLAAASY